MVLLSQEHLMYFEKFIFLKSDHNGRIIHLKPEPFLQLILDKIIEKLISKLLELVNLHVIELQKCLRLRLLRPFVN